MADVSADRRRKILPVLGNNRTQRRIGHLLTQVCYADAEMRGGGSTFTLVGLTWALAAAALQWCRAVHSCRRLHHRPALETNLRGWSIRCANTMLRCAWARALFALLDIVNREKTILAVCSFQCIYNLFLFYILATSFRKFGVVEYVIEFCDQSHLREILVAKIGGYTAKVIKLQSFHLVKCLSRRLGFVTFLNTFVTWNKLSTYLLNYAFVSELWLITVVFSETEVLHLQVVISLMDDTKYYWRSGCMYEKTTHG